MSRRFDPRDSGFEYQGQGYRGSSDPYPPPRSTAARPPAGAEGPPPPHGPPYYASPAAYPHHAPPPAAAGSDPRAYWPTEAPPAQHPALAWSEPPSYRYDTGRYAEGAYPAASAHSRGPPPPPHAYEPAPRGPPTQPGYQQPSAPASQHFGANPFPQAYGPRTRRRPKEQARAACSNCKRDHVSCDNSRPCRRCVSGGKEATCADVPPKKRGRPKVRPDPVTFRPLPGPPEFRSQRATDQAEVPAQYDSEPVLTAGLPPKESLDPKPTKYPPSSWLSRGAQLSPPSSASAHTAAGAPPPAQARPSTVAGPRPSPPTHQSFPSAALSPIKPPRAGISLPTPGAGPASSSSPNTFSYPHVAASLPPPMDRYVPSAADAKSGSAAPAPALPPQLYPSSYGERPYSSYGTAPALSRFHDRPPPPPPHNPPIPRLIDRTGTQLPPLTSMHSNRPLSMATPERPEYDFAPMIPRREPSTSAPRSHRNSWHEPRSSMLLARRPSSQGGERSPRRRSLEPYSYPAPTLISPSTTAPSSAAQEQQEVVGQRRPSDESELADAEGRRKRQRVTLDEIMH